MHQPGIVAHQTARRGDQRHRVDQRSLAGQNAAGAISCTFTNAGLEYLSVTARMRPQEAAIGSPLQLAVSLEPAGGSTTGAPSGPVLFVGKLVL